MEISLHQRLPVFLSRSRAVLTMLWVSFDWLVAWSAATHLRQSSFFGDSMDSGYTPRQQSPHSAATLHTYILPVGCNTLRHAAFQQVCPTVIEIHMVSVFSNRSLRATLGRALLLFSGDGARRGCSCTSFWLLMFISHPSVRPAWNNDSWTIDLSYISQQAQCELKTPIPSVLFQLIQLYTQSSDDPDPTQHLFTWCSVVPSLLCP